MSINRRGFLGKLGLGAAVAAIPTALLTRPKSEVIETDHGLAQNEYVMLGHRGFMAGRA